MTQYLAVHRGGAVFSIGQHDSWANAVEFCMNNQWRDNLVLVMNRNMALKIAQHILEEVNSLPETEKKEWVIRGSATEEVWHDAIDQG